MAAHNTNHRRHSTPSSPRPPPPAGSTYMGSIHPAVGVKSRAYPLTPEETGPASGSSTVRLSRQDARFAPTPSPSSSSSPTRHSHSPIQGHDHIHGQRRVRLETVSGAMGPHDSTQLPGYPLTPTSHPIRRHPVVQASPGSTLTHPSSSYPSSNPQLYTPSSSSTRDHHTHTLAHGTHGSYDYRRAVSATPSSTSVSEGEDEEVHVSEEMRAWASKGKGKAKGKQKQDMAGLEDMDVDVDEEVGRPGRVGIDDLPPEVLLHIFRLLPDSASLVPLLLVNRQWSLFAYPFIWQKPLLTSPVQFAAFVRVINSSSAHPSSSHLTSSSQPSSPTTIPSTHPYALAVKRLNLTSVASSLTDETFLGLRHCTRVERLTFSGSSKISAGALRDVLACMPELGSLDLSASEGDRAGEEVTDEVLRTVARVCKKLQGANLSRCQRISDEGVLELAQAGLGLKRVRLQNNLRLTDLSLCALLRASPFLLEIDLANLPQMTNATVYSVFLNASHVRELDLKGNQALTSEGFPHLPELAALDDAQWEEAMLAEPWKPRRAGLPISTQPPGNASSVGRWANGVVFPHSNDTAHGAAIRDFSAQMIDRWPGWPVLPIESVLRRPLSVLEHLRVVDLYGCSNLGDEAVRSLVASAPRLRNLTLAKCPNLTDGAVEAICDLGRQLHYLHLGHVALVTDAAMIKLSKSCTRIRYIDLACCELLTDVTVFELAANLPKLRRIGLVKVTKITDEAIHALAERHDSLERIHLSYCDKVSVDAIAYLLNNLMSLTHLSLTGVSAFKKSELQQFCRPVPSNFNTHQQETFCVFSGLGINALRNHLNSRSVDAVAESDSSVHTNTRRNSASSTSSITIPGGPADDVDAADGVGGAAGGTAGEGGNIRYRSSSTGYGHSYGNAAASPTAASSSTSSPQSAQAPYRDISASRASATRSTGHDSRFPRSLPPQTQSRLQPQHRQPGFPSTGWTQTTGPGPSSPGRATAMFATLALPPTVPRTPPPVELMSPPPGLFGAHFPSQAQGQAWRGQLSAHGESPMISDPSALSTHTNALPGPNLSVFQTNIERPPESLGPYFSYMSAPILHSTRPPSSSSAYSPDSRFTGGPSGSGAPGSLIGGSVPASPVSPAGTGAGAVVGKTGTGKKWFASLGRWGGAPPAAGAGAAGGGVVEERGAAEGSGSVYHPRRTPGAAEGEGGGGGDGSAESVAGLDRS